MLTIKLNGVPIVGRVEGLEDFTLTYNRDSETGTTQKSFSNDLTFYDDGFDLIYPILVSSPTGLNNSIRAEIWDDCCNTAVYSDLIIRGDMVDYCSGDCWVRARLTRQDPDELIYQCLRKHEISDNRNNYFYYNPNGQPKFPLVAYCNELRPNWLMAVLIVLGLLVTFLAKSAFPVILGLLSLVILFLLVICGALKIIESAINLIPTVNKDITPPICDQTLNDPLYLIKELDDIFDFLIQNFIGCGRKHPTPLYRQYAENACQICGINQFSSSILNDPASEYYNALYFYAPADAGSRNPTAYISENRPTMTMDVWFSTIARDFNARWWVSNGVLYFERKDYYLNQPPIYDAVANAETGDILEGVCFQYNDGKLFASIKIEAIMDALDDVGNEDRNRYTWYLDYGNNNNWEGCDKRTLSYSPARFRDDGVEPDILSQFATVPGVNFLFNGQLTGTNDYLLMSKGTATNPKMLIWDGQSYTTAIVKKYQGVQNMPAMVNSNQFDLYARFYQIDNPNSNPFRFWSAELTVRADCSIIRNLDVNRTVRLKTPYGAIVNARINTITANLGQREVRFNCEF